MEINTKFGTARINSSGYYHIISNKEGNNCKKLHRLIYEDYYKVSILPDVVVHHKDGNRINNEISNLELMLRGEHTKMHLTGINRPKEVCSKISNSLKGKKHPMYGKHHTEETKLKISKAGKGVKHSDNHKREISKSQNSTGIYRVIKRVMKSARKGYSFEYKYYDDEMRRRTISSVDINNLKSKVIAAGLPWEILDEDKAKVTMQL